MNNTTPPVKHHSRFGFQTVLACLPASVGTIGPVVEGGARNHPDPRPAAKARYATYCGKDFRVSSATQGG